jgi:hypothetical protein
MGFKKNQKFQFKQNLCLQWIQLSSLCLCTEPNQNVRFAVPQNTFTQKSLLLNPHLCVCFQLTKEQQTHANGCITPAPIIRMTKTWLKGRIWRERKPLRLSVSAPCRLSTRNSSSEFWVHALLAMCARPVLRVPRAEKNAAGALHMHNLSRSQQCVCVCNNIICTGSAHSLAHSRILCTEGFIHQE